ncbi:MAG: outer membrane beta-barrel protein [Phocaeicola sp.]|uniref:outer membrane beta-barrel protein n=1 Tax=Phocaeicola sp. TaxID=2773926 RepID=UPI003FA192D8
MKKMAMLFVASLIMGHIQAQQRQGIVANSKGEPVEFATIALVSDSIYINTAVSDSCGIFRLNIADGTYHVIIRHIAYQPIREKVTLIKGNQDMGKFIINESKVSLDDVVVTAQPITRETDRFIMHMNTPSLFLNKNASEILPLAPGVFINDNGISINGAQGAKVYINEKEVKLKGSELINYLKNFKSSDIARVEIIPIAGAEYSAESNSGVIKIILKKQQEKGISGNIQSNTSQGEYINNYSASVSMNIHSGRWSFNILSTGLITAKGKEVMTGYRDYADNDNWNFSSDSRTDSKPNSLFGQAGAIYDLDSRNSIGLELEMTKNNHKKSSKGIADIINNSLNIHSVGNYYQKENNRNISATFNYIHKIDSAGSILKFIADYTHQEVKGNNDYHSNFELKHTGSIDSIYQSKSLSAYKIFTADIAFNKSAKKSLKYTLGMKYTRNKMDDWVNYQSYYQKEWIPIPQYHYTQNYNENIHAIYGTASMRLKRIDFAIGMRGEYTYTKGQQKEIQKSYFDLFPNASLTYSFNEMKTMMLIAQFSRSIQRPNFWYLNPNRVQYNDYSYYVGNPNLKPTYINKIGLTAVYHYRYILSIGGNLHHNLIRELGKTDNENPTVSYITPVNNDKENHWYMVVSAPIQVTNRWTLHINAIGVKQNITSLDTNSSLSHYLYFVNANTGFTLPHKFYIELAYQGTSRLYSANAGINSLHLFHVNVKKQLMKDKLSITIGMKNIFNAKTSYFTNMSNYTAYSTFCGSNSSRFIHISLQYNFNSGKSFKKNQVESAMEIEKQRLNNSISNRN